MSLWANLPRPFFVLAPMEDVTDTVFRQIVASCGRPDAFFTEFTSCAGLLSVGRNVVSQRLVYTQGERPLIAQIWGRDPKQFVQIAQMLREQGFDGIDINLGCPDKSVMKQGCGASLIEDTETVRAIVEATKETAGDLPVSIKTRIGKTQIVTESWISFLLTLPIQALTIHGRTAKELSAVPTHWDEIGKAVKLRDEMGKSIPIIGNGDVLSKTQARELVRMYGVDGCMIGRGIFQNPWVFADEQETTRTLSERLELLRKHVRLWESTWGDEKNFAIIKKFFKVYVQGFPDASQVREQLATVQSGKEVEAIIDEVLGKV